MFVYDQHLCLFCHLFSAYNPAPQPSSPGALSAFQCILKYACRRRKVENQEKLTEKRRRGTNILVNRDGRERASSECSLHLCVSVFAAHFRRSAAPWLRFPCIWSGEPRDTLPHLRGISQLHLHLHPTHSQHIAFSVILPCCIFNACKLFTVSTFSPRPWRNICVCFFHFFLKQLAAANSFLLPAISSPHCPSPLGEAGLPCFHQENPPEWQQVSPSDFG